MARALHNSKTVHPHMGHNELNNSPVNIFDVNLLWCWDQHINANGIWESRFQRLIFNKNFQFAGKTLLRKHKRSLQKHESVWKNKFAWRRIEVEQFNLQKNQRVYMIFIDLFSLYSTIKGLYIRFSMQTVILWYLFIVILYKCSKSYMVL